MNNSTVFLSFIFLAFKSLFYFHVVPIWTDLPNKRNPVILDFPTIITFSLQIQNYFRFNSSNSIWFFIRNFILDLLDVKVPCRLRKQFLKSSGKEKIQG